MYVCSNSIYCPNQADQIQIHDCLIFLINRTKTFLERAEESQCHKMATGFLISSAKTELAPSTPPKVPASPAKSNTQARRKSSGADRALRTRRDQRRSSGIIEEDIDPELLLAKTLGITLPMPAGGFSESERIEILAKQLREREDRLETHATTLETATESSIASHLLDAHLTLEMLHDSLLAESRYGSVHLLDPSLVAQVDAKR